MKAFLLLIPLIVLVSGCTIPTGQVIDRGEDSNITANASQPAGITKPADLCLGVSCPDSKRRCQDGVEVSCKNSCFEGKCSQCIPDCSNHSPARVNLCDGIECTDSKITCPDGTILTCPNSCIPTTGQCSECELDCSGHEFVDPCKDVTCGDSVRTCADGFNATCINTCTDGFCSACQPSCIGHEIQTCTESWSCTSWSECVNGTQTRTCTDSNSCGTTESKPAEMQNCTPSGPLIMPEIINISYNPEGPDDLSKLNEEYVVIFGIGVDMTGWTLSDNKSHVYQFPNYTIESIAIVHTGSGTDNSTDLFWGRGSWVWNNNHDKATLKDPQGTVVSEFSY